MKIIGIAVIGAYEKYLDKPLADFKRLCDNVLIATNNTDEETLKKIQSYGFDHYEDNREWGVHQPTIKTDLLTKAGKYNPDWIIALDADEQFAPEFTREEAERLSTMGEIAFHFLIVNLYNDAEHFTHSTGIQRFWNVRFYKYLPEHGLQFQRKALHCGLAPPIMYQYGWHAPFYVLHYGLMLPEDRKRKAERYRKYDPMRMFKAGTYYDELEVELPMYKFDPEGLLAKIKASPETQLRKRPKFLEENYNRG